MSKKKHDSHHDSKKKDEMTREEAQEQEVQKEQQEELQSEEVRSSSIEELQKEIDTLKREKAELEDFLKRKVAEFDNYKKRVLREKEEFRVLANKNLVLEILPIIDNFERALKASEQNQSFEAMLEGLRMVHQQMDGLLEKHEVSPIPSVGEEFDPNLHEAYMVEETEDEDQSNKVIDEFEKGYRMGDVVIRHSKVKVAKKKA